MFKTLWNLWNDADSIKMLQKVGLIKQLYDVQKETWRVTDDGNKCKILHLALTKPFFANKTTNQEGCDVTVLLKLWAQRKLCVDDDKHMEKYRSTNLSIYPRSCILQVITLFFIGGLGHDLQRDKKCG